MSTSEIRVRITVGFVLATVIFALIASGATRLTHVLILLALGWDLLTTVHSILSRIVRCYTLVIFLIYWVFVVGCTEALVYIYVRDPTTILLLVIIVQASDALQYAIGASVGTLTVTQISPKKTWEGYLGSITTLLVLSTVGILLIRNIVVGATSSLHFHILYTTLLPWWFLGAVGGLLSSWVKRRIGVKDYSRLLGPHGGWLDRTDSLHLPILYSLLTNTLV